MSEQATQTEPLRNFREGEIVEVQGIRFHVCGSSWNGVVLLDMATNESFIVGPNVQGVRI